MEVCLFLSTVPDDPESEAIRARTQCDWSHIGFYRLVDGWTFSAMADGKGVAWRPPNPRAKILKLLAPGIDAALSVFLTQEGKPYNFLGIAGIALGQNWTAAPDAWFCMEGICWAFEQTNNPLLNPTFIPRNHLTPRDILLSPYVQEIRN